MNGVVRFLTRSLALVAIPVVASAQKQAAAAPPLPPLTADVTAALEELSPRFAADVELIQGWYRDHMVLYYNFGPVPAGAAPGRVFWPIHGFDAHGNPVAIRGQRPIFSTIPGLPGYSGVFKLAYVVTADHAQPNQLRDIAAVDAAVKAKKALLRETDVTYNLPIVPKGSKLARDSTPGLLGWYEGRDVQFFDFGAVKLEPVAMWRFTRDSSADPLPLEGQNSIVDSIPVAGTFPDIWEIRFVRVDSAYAANSLKSASAVRSAPVVVGPVHSIRNLPITIMDGTAVKRAPSPIQQFSDLRSPFPPAPTRPQ